MRVQEMGLPLLGLGQHVHYTHRASSVRAVPVGKACTCGYSKPVPPGEHRRRWHHDPDCESRLACSGEARDLARSDHWRARTLGMEPGPLRAGIGPYQHRHHPAYGWPVPVRKALGRSVARPVDRWVVAWPEHGRGVVCGLTYRYEGWRDNGGDEGNTFRMHAKWPLYEVKAALTGRIALVPPWACVPYPPEPWSVVYGLEGVPEYIAHAGATQPWDSWAARYTGRAAEHLAAMMG